MDFNSVVLMIVRGLEIIAILVIVIAFLHATIIPALRFERRHKNMFLHFKLHFGRALQLSLEFFIAADLIRTVTIQPSQKELSALALLVLVRTFLSWSITVENEGCWPWQIAKHKKG